MASRPVLESSHLPFQWVLLVKLSLSEIHLSPPVSSRRGAGEEVEADTNYWVPAVLKGAGARTCCIYFIFYLYCRYLSTVQIKPLGPKP